MSSVASLGAAARTAGPADWKRDAALAVAVALLALCLHAAGGFQTLVASDGDNDSLLRLVQIRDLIGGQGWFDLHQYRMGPEGGFIIHWSRLVDAPIAAIVLAAAALTGSMATGETVALIAWPLALMAAAMFFLLRLARRDGGDRAVVPMLAIGAAALHFVGIFAPGNIDHHNVQLVLALAAIAALSATDSRFRDGAAAGTYVALMLAVGMETLPYVAGAGLYAALRLLFDGRDSSALASGFGIGLSAAAAIFFVATVPAAGWLAAQCDAYSIPQFAIAALGGAGLAVAASVESLQRSFSGRLVVLAMIGAAVAATAVLFFPQCLGDPFADLDPRLKTFWLNAITEAQPIWSMLKSNPAMVASYYVTPVIALVLIVLKMRRDGFSEPDVIVLAFLAAAIAVSIWEVRGSRFSLPLATIPLSAWVAGWRARAAAGGAAANLKMVLAWLVSLNVAWSASSIAVADALGVPLPPGAERSTADCDRTADFAALAALPATTVLAISNLGAPILSHTHHRVLAGPYHRNVAGNLLALEAFMGTQAEAEAVVRGNGVGFVALCPGNGETAAISRWAPSGFLVSLGDGTVPDWLERLPGDAGGALDIYRVHAPQ